MHSKEERNAAETKIHRSANFQRLFSGKDGEFVLNEIDKFTMYKENTFNPNPHKHAYNAGQRSMAVFIHNILDQDVESARRILKQEKENEQERQV